MTSETLQTDPRAAAFTRARATASALPVYPGTPPATMAEAYSVQDAAIALWPDRIAGWKVGKINAPWDAQVGTDRLIGPIFETSIRRDAAPVFDMPGFGEGFIAVEGECILIVGTDAPAGRLDWTLDDARALVGSVRLGVEIASSPFPGINDHGPLVTISDFGNNMGLIVGPEIPGWQAMDIGAWRFETRIDGAVIGAATPTSIPGGPVESLRACLEIAARRGLPLKAGMCISTGAVTGVHAVKVGQSSVVDLAGVASISCRFVPAFRLDADAAAQ
jgi:2-keto-4-pentenoate hydratase